MLACNKQSATRRNLLEIGHSAILHSRTKEFQCFHNNQSSDDGIRGSYSRNDITGKRFNSKTALQRDRKYVRAQVRCTCNKIECIRVIFVEFNRTVSTSGLQLLSTTSQLEPQLLARLPEHKLFCILFHVPNNLIGQRVFCNQVL